MPEVILSDYFYGDEAEQFQFFRIPRQLITNPRFKNISTDAKLLYGMLLDRMSLSAKNDWYDDDGRVYIYYTLDEICRDINCGTEKAVKLLADLDSKKGIGLIERIKQGQGKPTKIYVKRFAIGTIPAAPTEPSPTTETPSQDFGISEMQTSEKQKSRPRKSESAEFRKSKGNYNNINQTEVIHTDLSIYPRFSSGKLGAEIDRYELRNEIKENIDYKHLMCQHPHEDVESLLELIVDVAGSTAVTMRIGGEIMSAETVKQRFRQLDSSHIEYVLDSLKQTTTKINNIRAYLLTTLYNAPVTIGPYYSAAVRHDFG